MEHPFNETQSGVYSLPTTFHLLIPSCKRSPIQDCMNRLYRGSFIQLLCNDRLFQSILCCKFFKFRKRIHNCLIGYTICKSHITGACEGASRYHKDVIFLTGFTEGFFVFNRRFYKEIEGTLWFDALKSAFFTQPSVRFAMVAAEISSSLPSASSGITRYPIRSPGRERDLL